MTYLEQDNLEAGQLRKPLHGEVKPDEIDEDESVSSDDSSVTACVVFSTLVAVCGSFCYGSSMAYTSPAESGIMRDMGLSATDYSLFGSFLTVGGVIGASLSGRIVAGRGQRYGLWISELFAIVGWFAIALAKDAWVLFAGRLSLGVGIGLITYVVPFYIAEIAPKNLRGTFASMNSLMTTCGFSIVYFMGNMISWRWLATVGTTPFVLQFIGLFLIPESPRWLAKSGKEKECIDALRRLRGENCDISQEVEEIQENVLVLKQQPPERFSDVLQRKYLYSLIVGVGLMLLQQLGGSSAMSFYSSSIFEKANFPSSIGSSAIAIVQVPTTVACLFLMDLCGRRPLLLVSASGMSLCCFLIGLSFLWQNLGYMPRFTPVLAFIGVLGYPAISTFGMAGIPWIIMAEIFPANVKASAGSLVSLVSWSGIWIVTYSFNFMMEWNYPATFFIFSAICASTVVFIWKLVPETKGRTLEEIQESFTQAEYCK